MQTHYQRTLPHILPPGECVFITYRLAGSIPAAVLLRLQEEKQIALRQIGASSMDSTATAKARLDESKRYFAAFDNYLDTAHEGPHWLKVPSIADIIKKGIHSRHAIDYDLQAYCIMSNHVHLLVSIRETNRPFHQTLKSLKGYSARHANELLGRTGQSFWQAESYDHVVRNHEEFKRIVAYILNNPVKAGFVDDWEKWPHSYLADGI
ncbi:REP-associated tyrosine transposase [Spirosoma foliorum]|uniref:Transposase n=1 Tax=Spirosoma foliorum TaxID=2710596 RepID=A0A7G5GQK3_9BACT|nr:transposase [Spirosoma foliorum]QMW01145.1 transposase [Spirosoma foliorum]